MPSRLNAALRSKFTDCRQMLTASPFASNVRRRVLISSLNAAFTSSFLHHSSIPNIRFIGTNSRPEPAYEGHIPLNWFENAFLAAGSAFMSLANPRRGDMVAALGETTAGPSISRLRDIMLESPEGRRILKNRPRINTSTINLKELAELPEGSFGKTYVTWLERCGVTPDTREPVHYISDPELAYVMQRYRECHDFYHTLCSLPVNVESELALKYFEFANLGLPVAAISALFGPLRLNTTKRDRLFKEYVPWALRCGSSAKSLITVYWEERWAMQVAEIKKELGVWDPPEARWSRPLKEAQEAVERKRGSEAGQRLQEVNTL